LEDELTHIIGVLHSNGFPKKLLRERIEIENSTNGMVWVLFWVDVAVAFTSINKNLIQCLSYRKIKPINIQIISNTSIYYNSCDT
jgi:hypothetical protein